MTGFELGSSGIRSDRAANCATTTALLTLLLNESSTYGLFFIYFNATLQFYNNQVWKTFHLSFGAGILLTTFLSLLPLQLDHSFYSF